MRSSSYGLADIGLYENSPRRGRQGPAKEATPWHNTVMYFVPGLEQQSDDRLLILA